MIESSVIELAKKGDHAAFKVIYQKYIGYVYSIVRRYVNNGSDHPDVIQEIYARLFLSIKKYDETKGEFKFWMRRLVINQCLKHRQQGKSPKLFVPIEQAYELEAGEEIPMNELTKAEIENHLRNMPDGYRQIFMLVIIDEYSHKEVGELLNISVETSRSQLSRAKSWLRKNVFLDQCKILVSGI